EPLKKQPSAASAHAGIVVQQGWPGCPQASQSDTPPIATQVFPALHAVPQHGCPGGPHGEHIAPTHPPEELPPLLPEPEPPLLAPSEPASSAGVELIPPPHPESDMARSSPQGARPCLHARVLEVVDAA